MQSTAFLPMGRRGWRSRLNSLRQLSAARIARRPPPSSDGSAAGVSTDCARRRGLLTGRQAGRRREPVFAAGVVADAQPRMASRVCQTFPALASRARRAFVHLPGRRYGAAPARAGRSDYLCGRSFRWRVRPGQCTPALIQALAQIVRGKIHQRFSIIGGVKGSGTVSRTCTPVIR